MTVQLLGKSFRMAAVLITAMALAAGMGAFIVTAAADPLGRTAHGLDPYLQSFRTGVRCSQVRMSLEPGT
jgi:hypothetical protein